MSGGQEHANSAFRVNRQERSSYFSLPPSTFTRMDLLQERIGGMVSFQEVQREDGDRRVFRWGGVAKTTPQGRKPL